MTVIRSTIGNRIGLFPILAASGLIGVEAILVLAYLAITPTTVTAPRYVIYPFVWINVGLWTAYSTSPIIENRRQRYLATGIAISYYLLLLAIAGNVVVGASGGTFFSVEATMPGWGPVVHGGLPGLAIHLIPFETIGYGALAYLFYANVLDLSKGILAGALGIFTCVSCSLPLWAPIIGLIGGPLAGLSDTVTYLSYDVGTLVFLGTALVMFSTQAGHHSDRSPRGWFQ